MIPPTTAERALPWVLRLLWVGVLVVGGAAIDGATAERSDAVAMVARAGGGALWSAGVAALAVPAVRSLTAARAIVPLSLVVAALAWIDGADAVDGAAFVALAGAATVIVISADIGRAFVQASAYGDEDRHVLRPPAAYALAAVLAWCAVAVATVSGPLLLASHQWLIGVPITIAAVAGVVFASPRWHRLSRRWFVIMPVGLVVHDHLVLGETLMLRRQDVAHLHLAPADTEAADLTGPASGHTIEIVTARSVTAILAGTPSRPGGSAIHLSSCLVAPSRPGRALAAAAQRRLPVG